MDPILSSSSGYFKGLTKGSSFILNKQGEILFWPLVANEFENVWMEKKFPVSRQRDIISGFIWLQNLTAAAQDSLLIPFQSEALPSYCPTFGKQIRQKYKN